MRPEKLYLLDILTAADALLRFVEPIDEAQFMQDELRQSAVLQKLTVIGEAAGRLSGEFQAVHSQIEWRDIIAFRNIAVHEYFSIMWDIVWNTAIGDVPALRSAVADILEAEFNLDNADFNLDIS